MSDLKKVIAERCVKMMAIGLVNKPYHRNESEFKAMLEVWHEAITHAGYGDQDAAMVAKAWNELLRTSRNWFYPKDLMAVVRIDVELREQIALPNLSDEQRIENLKKVQQMAAIAFSGPNE